ncbi:MAG TPA: glycosyltransferase family 39 protein [Coleofasciculaceae cyanobacterium]
MADAFLRRDWEEAINGYFSPFYSWLLMIFLSIVKPSMYWKFFAVKVVNFLMYIISLIAFEVFLSEFIQYYYNKNLSKPSKDRYYLIPEWVWLVSGYILFSWSSLKLIGVDKDNPDMLVAALVYLATAIVLRVHRRSDNWLNFISLGAILGLGYLSKTFMFPMSFIFLGICFFSIRNHKLAIFKVLTALLVFSLITSPFIYILSNSKGHLTFGDNGKLNYAWYISGMPSVYWQGEPPGSGSPKHPIKKIFDNPVIYEFGMHFNKTTYPIWYDSSYWFEGMKFKLNLPNQINIILKNIIFYYQHFLGILLFSYLIIAAMSDKFLRSLKNLTEGWILLIPAGIGLTLYMLATNMPAAQPSMRYIAPFVVLLFAGVFSTVQIPNSQGSRRLITGITLSTLILISVQFTELWESPGEPIYWKVAQGLNELGIHSGDKVSIIQLRGQNGTKDYWARLAELTIIAEIPDTKSFWETDSTTRSKIYEAIDRTGARAIVQKLGVDTPDYLSESGWRRISNTNYYTYLF